MLNKLSGRTQSRKNLQTGEREFLLHRQLSQRELDKYRKDNVYSNHETHSSWTPFRSSITESHGIYSKAEGEEQKYNHILSAWIPESKIKSYIPQYGNIANAASYRKLGPANGHIAREQEVIVRPGSQSEIHEILKDSGRHGHRWDWEQVFGDPKSNYNRNRDT